MEEISLADFYSGKGAPTVRKRSTPVRLLANAAHLYRLRVREQPMQELLALIGIAAGVALLFAVQVASTSVTGAVRQLAQGITGNASLEVAARGPDGTDQAIVAKAQALPAVKVAAPVVQQRITVVGPAGSAPLTLVGVDERLKKAGGEVVRRFTAKRGDLDALGLFLTAPTAKAIGVRPGQRLTVESGAMRRELPLAGTLGADEIGDLEQSPVAMAPLGLAQRLADMQGHISRVLIEPRPGMEAQAKEQLKKIAADRLDVRASDTEADLLAQALKPDQQSSALFSAIAVVIGMLFAYNAMLLAMSRRRRIIAYLRMVGAGKPTLVSLFIFEAAVLGFVASLVGIGIGEFLSRAAFRSIPEYLTSGFPIGAQRVVDARTIALSVAGGLAAALLASVKPAFDLYRVSPAEAVDEVEKPQTKKFVLRGSITFWLGISTISIASVLIFLEPMIIPVGIGALIIGLCLVLAPLSSFLLGRLNRVTRVRGSVGLALAVDELRSTPVRATALAVIVAVAMAAILSIGGARLDLARGVDRLNDDFYGTSALWITPGGKANAFLTQKFDLSMPLKKLEKERGLQSFKVFYGSLLDLKGARVLIIARANRDPKPLAPSQIVAGSAKMSTDRLRSGGWIAASESVSRSLKIVRVGDEFSLPTPTGSRKFRLAAKLANYGWPPGVIVMNSRDYQRYWNTNRPSALTATLNTGTSLTRVQQAAARSLLPNSALRVQTATEMVNDRAQTLNQGLARVRQISSLVLGASALAIVSAMFAAVWQRRKRLAALRAIGLYRSELYSTLFVETGLVVLLGGLVGLVFGLYCQFFASRWTEIAGGYRSPYEPALAFGFVTLAEMMALALLATVLPAYIASRVEPMAGSGA